MATNVNVNAEQIAENGLSSRTGLKLGFIDSGAKAAQNDTWTVKNVKAVIWASLTIDASGAAEPYTISGATITLTSATATPASGFILYR